MSNGERQHGACMAVLAVAEEVGSTDARADALSCSLALSPIAI